MQNGIYAKITGPLFADRPTNRIWHEKSNRLIALGLAVAFILLLIFGRDVAFHFRSVSSNPEAVPTSAPEPSSLQVTEPQSSLPPSVRQTGSQSTSVVARPITPTEISKLYLKLTKGSDPRANQLFKDCFQLIDQGNYREAKEKLKGFMEGKSVAGDEFMPPAWWMLAWCILSEGGKENMLDAAERFFIYTKMWPASGERSSYSTAAIAADYEELTKAAYFNRAVINADLLNTTEGEQKKYTDNAAESLNLFLARWPNDPRASAVRNLLDSLNGFHSSP